MCRANWPTGSAKDFDRIQIALTSNLGTNAGVMAMAGLGYPVSIEGAARYWCKRSAGAEKIVSCDNS